MVFDDGNGNVSGDGEVLSIIANGTIEVMTNTIEVGTEIRSVSIDKIVYHLSQPWQCPNCGYLTEVDTCPCGPGWTREEARSLARSRLN